MLIQYNGPHPEVVVDELDQEQVITAGEPVEIPDDLAARLIEQDTWAVAEPAKPASTSSQALSQTLSQSTTSLSGVTSASADSIAVTDGSTKGNS